MRDKLNSSPAAQIGLIVALIAAAAFLLLGKGGGSGGKGAETASPEVVATVNGTTATGASAGEAVEGAVESLEAGGEAGAATAALPTSVPAPPPPDPFTAAYESGNTVVLLIVHDGGIDDALTTQATATLAGVPNVSLFVVPVRQIARYAAVTIGLDVNRVPALVVMRPKRLSGGTPQATVDYGYQTPQTVLQDVLDASYKGPEDTYHPN